MPIIKCQNPDQEAKGSWLKSMRAFDDTSRKVVGSSQLPDEDLIWIKNGQSLAYTYHEEIANDNHMILNLNLAGHSKLFAYAPHFPDLIDYDIKTVKEKLEKDWVFFHQVNNNWLAPNNHADNTCNSSSNAMFLEHFKPECIVDDQDYINVLFDRQYISTNHQHQTFMLESYGLNTHWKTNAYWGDLIEETDKGNPTVVGWYHRGSKWHPWGGHVGMIIDATEDYVEVLDPYGDMLDGYTSDVWNGYRVVYPRSEFEPRWVGNGQGWMRQYKSGRS